MYFIIELYQIAILFIIKNQSSMDIPKLILSVRQLNQYNVDDSARLLARNFLMKNNIQSQYNLTYDQIFTIMRGKVVHAVPECSSFVLFQDQKIIGLSLNYDITNFKNLKNMPNSLQIFSKIITLDTQIQKGVDLKQIKKGQAIFNAFLVIDPDYDHKKYLFDFLWETLAASKLIGYKFYYFKSTNLQILNILYKLGAFIVKEEKFEYKNIDQRYLVVKMDLKKPLPSHSQFKKTIKLLSIGSKL